MGFWGEYKTWTPSVDQVLGLRAIKKPIRSMARAITNMDHLQERPFMDWVHGPLLFTTPCKAD